MKIILKVFLWSTGSEMVLVTPIWISNHLHLGVFDAVFGVLTYLALFCHVPAFYLLYHRPAARETLIIPVLVEWSIFFTAFLILFMLRHLFRRRSCVSGKSK